MTRDLAAIPTSISLTLWDALPLYLSLIAAFTILVTVLLPSSRQAASIETFRRFGVHGVIYLAITSPPLALPWAIASLFGGSALMAVYRRGRASVSASALEPGPGRSTLHTVRAAAGDTLWQVLIAAGIVAIYEHILRNVIGMNPIIWAIALGCVAAVFKLRPGPAAIIGTAFAVETGAWAATICVLLPVYLNEVVLARYSPTDLRTVLDNLRA